jgi:hypothetical protein
MQPQMQPPIQPPIQPPDTRAPRVLRSARAVLYVQGVASAFQAAILIAQIVSREDHNQEVPGFAYVFAVVNPLVVVLAFVCAAMIVSRRPWVRTLTIVVESVAILNCAINVASGFPQALVAMMIAIGVITLVARREVTEWLAAGGQPWAYDSNR